MAKVIVHSRKPSYVIPESSTTPQAPPSAVSHLPAVFEGAWRGSVRCTINGYFAADTLVAYVTIPNEIFLLSPKEEVCLYGPSLLIFPFWLGWL